MREGRTGVGGPPSLLCRRACMVYCVTEPVVLHQKECNTNRSQLATPNWQRLSRPATSVAFAELVERHSGTVYNLALRMMGNPQEAEEVLQETFISAFRSLDRFEGRSQLGTWLYRIAYNAALMRLRKRQVPTSSIDEPLIGEDGEELPRQLIDWDSLPDDIALNRELRAELDKAVSTLPATLRSVFVLTRHRGAVDRRGGRGAGSD